MPTYDSIINRDSSDDPLVPEQISNEIIQEMPKSSAMMALATRVPLTSKTGRQPVLSALPAAYWVDGDTGMKQTTSADWKNLTITAEELAAIVVIPDAYFDDASVPLWESIRPLLASAIGKKVDEAAMFGTDAPASWPDSIVEGAISAGNEVVDGTGSDLGVDVASLGETMALQGFSINGFATAPGLNWRLRGVRDDQGAPLFVGDSANPSFYGYPHQEVTNGSWQADEATIVAADWSKVVVGVRQDITFKIFDTGVISDDEGAVVVNLMQQDAKAMRVVFRVGFQVANPVTALEATEGSRYPAGVITPAAS